MHKMVKLEKKQNLIIIKNNFASRIALVRITPKRMECLW